MNYTIMLIFYLVPPEGLKAMSIQCWFSDLALACRDCSGFSESSEIIKFPVIVHYWTVGLFAHVVFFFTNWWTLPVPSWFMILFSAINETCLFVYFSLHNIPSLLLPMSQLFSCCNHQIQNVCIFTKNNTIYQLNIKYLFCVLLSVKYSCT